MSSYKPIEIEQKWQKKWQKMKIYRFDRDSDKKVYSIDNPPRYASGALHIGHAVHYTHIDFVARYKRMRGYNVFFPLCFDVNGIPIEERVERKYGITRKDIERHEFIKLCEKFAEENIDEMIHQFMVLGESMDDSIFYRTDAKYYRRITQISFIKLYKKGCVYQGEFPVNWCPRCMTAMADAEIEHVERNTILNTIKFYFSSEEKGNGIKNDEKGSYIEIATTRPEMLSTCQIVAIHPDDERALTLVGKEVVVPIYGKRVKIVKDERVDPEFGTGIVMVCTIGDKEDLEWAMKYDLPIEICINEDGTMNEIAGKYAGMKVEKAREKIIEDLEKENYIVKQEKIEQSVGVCWRCKTPIEFIQTKQWFLKILPFKEEILKVAKRMKWYPEYMFKRLEEWVNSLKWDWVISRQRYFATPIPVWECEKCNEVVLAKEEQCYVDPTIDEPPVPSCPKCGGKLVGSENVFDTWMDSSITPLFNTFWNRDKEMFKKLYPMSLRPQAHDIIRTWAFYTILRCFLLTDKEPFEELMIDGFILAPDGKPMHTSLGNVIDPLKIIEEYGSDALRYYAGTCKLGEDNPFRYKDLVRGIRLMNKIWNVEKFIGNSIKKKYKKEDLNLIDRWILSLYSRVVKKSTEYMDKFEFSNAMKEIEYFLWHEFADHYIEMVKHRVYEKEDESALYTLYTIGLGIIKLFSPFLPFLTEEIYDLVYKKFERKESIHLSEWPQPVLIDEEAEEKGEIIKEAISKIREWKSRNGIALNAPIKKVKFYGEIEGKDIISSTLRIENISVEKEKLKVKKIALPLYQKIGPHFKEKSKLIVDEIKKRGEEIAEEIEKKGFYSFKAVGEEIKIDENFVEIVEEAKENLLKAKDVFILVEK
ncbi:MAG TPA: valine--tRNA ligase [Thermoplasmatales archaeon]|nr:valine--tRNA ligase [Thermoplasmatales archaeon]